MTKGCVYVRLSVPKVKNAVMTAVVVNVECVWMVKNAHPKVNAKRCANASVQVENVAMMAVVGIAAYVRLAKSAISRALR